MAPFSSSKEKTQVARRWERSLERDGPGSPLEILGREASQGTWEVEGLEGDDPQRARVSQGGEGPSFPMACWGRILAL